MKPLLFLLLAVLVLLHTDFWLWNDASSRLGLPVGLTYHLLYCLATTALMWLLVRFAWPDHLDSESSAEPPGA